LAVAADAQQDQARVDGLQGLGAQAPAFHGPGAEVFDQHIGVQHQLAHDVLCGRVFEVQRQRAFVARLHLPPDRGAVFEQAPLAQRIASDGRFDLDHVRTKIAQGFGGKRTGDQLAKLHHFQTRQRTGGRGKFRDWGHGAHGLFRLSKT
jgi:hypothetical protein